MRYDFALVISAIHYCLLICINAMLIDVLKITSLLAALVVPLFFPVKKINIVRPAKNHNDTSDANYAINVHGTLEEIHHDNISSRELN